MVTSSCITLNSLNHYSNRIGQQIPLFLSSSVFGGKHFCKYILQHCKMFNFICPSLSDTNSRFCQVQFGNDSYRRLTRFLQSLHLADYELFGSKGYILFICIFLICPRQQVFKNYFQFWILDYISVYYSGWKKSTSYIKLIFFSLFFSLLPPTILYFLLSPESRVPTFL